MSYDGPSQEERLAELRGRRPATEVVLHEAPLPQPREALGQIVTSLRISRYDDPDNPVPEVGYYLFSVGEGDAAVTDTWHETVDDALSQAEQAFDVRRGQWSPPPDASASE